MCSLYSDVNECEKFRIKILSIKIIQLYTYTYDNFECTNIRISYITGVLISRLSIQRVLDVSAEWKADSNHSDHSSVQYDFRVTCDAHYYGSGCANLCRPRDDQFGHYTCSETGDIVCLDGWQGEYCTKGDLLF